MESYIFTKKLDVKKKYDVIVCGGGVAGAAAAYSAAKRGSSVLLLEKTTILGGLATTGLINLFVPMCNGRGKQIIFGLAEKWLRDSALYGYDTIPEPWKNGEPAEYTEVRYVQRYSPYIFAYQLASDMVSVGVDILFDCIGVEPVLDGDRCCGVVTESKSGLELYECKVLIDTTGDADLLRAAGVPIRKGENFFTYCTKMITLDGCKTALEARDIAKLYSGLSGGGINLYGDGQPSDVPRWSGLSVDEVNDYLLRNQLIVLDKLKASADKRRERDIAMIPTMPQFRTTACIVGDSTLTVHDAYKHYDDSICAINDFDHRDHLFEVRYGTLCRRDVPNILTAGRSASATGYGWDVLRVIPPAILTGQAAGEAASLAIEKKVDVAAVPIRELQSRLESANVMIRFPDEYVPEDKSVIIHGKNAAEIDGGHF
ncbi:MAG: FAD-dependent oxidoreductase [Ruminococcaceae bacterium]|nr:FAD-dependent oxidoreductase [Oscillospiraceae bacterium]